MSSLSLERWGEALVDGSPASLLMTMTTDSLVISGVLVVATLVLETMVVLTIAVSPRNRDAVFGMALLFHFTGEMALRVTFAGILIAYLMFVDWRRLPVPSLPGRLLQGKFMSVVATVAAAGTFLLWNHGLRRMITMDGLLDQKAIWWFALPVAFAWLIPPILVAVRTVGRRTSRKEG